MTRLNPSHAARPMVAVMLSALEQSIPYGATRPASSTRSRRDSGSFPIPISPNPRRVPISIEPRCEGAQLPAAVWSAFNLVTLNGSQIPADAFGARARSVGCVDAAPALSTSRSLPPRRSADGGHKPASAVPSGVSVLRSNISPRSARTATDSWRTPHQACTTSRRLRECGEPEGRLAATPAPTRSGAWAFRSYHERHGGSIHASRDQRNIQR